MTNAVALEFAARTDTGLVRSQNEDAIAISPAHGFALLADGMGGYNAGEVASGMAIAVTKGALEQVLTRSSAARLQRNQQLHQVVIDAIHLANIEIIDAAQKEPEYSGMGTTLVAAVFHGDSLTVAHIGDSRAYRFRDGEVEQITRDHSVLQDQLDAGMVDPELARFSLQKNLVTRAIGVAAEMEAEIHDHQIKAGDIYLLCSDGLSDLLTTQEIREILTAHQKLLDAACDALVQCAKDKGGYDNISVVLARVRLTEAPPANLLGRLLKWIRRSGGD